MKPRALFPSSAPALIPHSARQSPNHPAPIDASESHQNVGHTTLNPDAHPTVQSVLENVDVDVQNGSDNGGAGVISALREAIGQLEKSGEMVSSLQSERDEAKTHYATERENWSAHINTLESELEGASELIEFLESQNQELERGQARLKEKIDAKPSEPANGSSDDGILQCLSSLFDLKTEDLARQIVESTCEIVGAEIGVLTNFDAIDANAMRGLDALPPLVAYELFEFTQSVRQGKVVVIENESENTPRHCGFFNLIALPFAPRHEDGGVLLLANKTAGDFTSQDSHRLQQLEGQVIVALENARFYRQREERYNDTISALTDAIETRNAYSGGRSHSMMLLAVEIGKKLGLSDEQLEEVRQAALLHGIGKVGIPDGILLNTGRLNDEEQKIMRTHPVIGCDLVLRMPHLHFVADAILHQHEKWDGTGYPSGLSAEKIPLTARIVGAVNAFEAMTTPRLYRQVVSAQEAMEEMRRCAGTQFDPKIVDVLEKILQASQKTNDHLAILSEKTTRPHPDAIKRSQEQSNYLLQVIEQEELEQAQQEQLMAEEQSSSQTAPIHSNFRKLSR